MKQEVESIPGAYLWITDAKEIENYIPGSAWSAVYNLKDVPDPAKFDRFPGSGLKDTDFVPKNLNRKSFDKCDFAMKAVSHLTRESLATRFEFEAKMNSLVEKIREWNK